MIKNNLARIGLFASLILTSAFILFGPNLSNKTKKTKNQGINGLVNYENNCFINVILQSLASCNCFIDWLKISLQNQINDSSLQIINQDSYSISLNIFDSLLKLIQSKFINFNRKKNKLDTNLTYNLINLLQQLNTVNDLSSYSNLNPKQVLEILYTFNFPSSNIQQDAHELFNILTSSLENELFQNFPKYSLDNILIDERYFNDEEYLNQTYFFHEKNYFNLKRSLPTKGLLANQLYCLDCKHKFSVSFEPFHCISLVIPNYLKDTIMITLEDCLTQFFSNEIINDVECEVCFNNLKNKFEYSKNIKLKENLNEDENKLKTQQVLNEFKTSFNRIGNIENKTKSTFIKKLNFAKLPKLLVIHIQRLNWLRNGMPVKRNDNISFPEILVIDNYIFGSSKKDQKPKKNLIKNLDTEFRFNSFTNLNKSDNLLNINQLNSNLNINLFQNESFLHKKESILEKINSKSICEQSFFNNKYRYKLNACVVHLGNAFGGHYVNYRKLPEKNFSLNQKVLNTGSDASNSWFFVSDTNVKNCKLKDVLSNSAYMLFYERI